MGYFKLQVLKAYCDTISDVNFFLSGHWMLVFYVHSEFPNTFLSWKTRKKIEPVVTWKLLFKFQPKWMLIFHL